MHDGKAPVGGWMHIKFDNAGTCLNGSMHRANGVLDVIVSRREDAFGRAGITVEVLAVIGLVNAAVRDQLHLRVAGRSHKPGSIGDVYDGGWCRHR